MWRVIFVAVLGVCGGGVATWIVEAIGHSVYPPPEEIMAAMDPANSISDAERAALLKTGVAKLTAGDFGFVLLAWFLGGLTTSLLAGVIIPFRRKQTVLIAASGYWLFCLLNLIWIPGPFWFMGVGSLIPLVGAGLGWLLVEWIAPKGSQPLQSSPG